MITNAKDTLLDKNTGTLPNMSDVLNGWLQPMVFTGIKKTIVNFQVVETPTTISFMGVWQPFSERKLALKPEGQRSWRWFSCFSDAGLVLNTDEVICYLGKQYRVMGTMDYRLEGYMEYHLVEDYTQGVS